MKRKLTFFALLALQLSVCQAQFRVKIEENISFPDLTVRISETSSFPNIKVKIGENISFEDFTIGFTTNPNDADFIISTGTSVDLVVKATEDLSFPDLSIIAGPDISFADVNIEIRNSGTVEYLIYSDKETISTNEMVLCLLPAINKFLDYKFEKIPLFAPEYNKTTKNINSTDSYYIDLYETLKNAHIIAQDEANTYLGQIRNEADSKSIFKTYGDYGADYSKTSIWCGHSEFGSTYGSYSAYNERCTKPPLLIKNGEVVGYLTTNKAIEYGISPNLVKGLRSKF